MINISNNLLAVMVIVAIVSSVGSTAMMFALFQPQAQPQQITGMTQNTAQGQATVSLYAEANLQLLVSSVDFGNITIGSYKDTMNWTAAHPFVLENNGSIAINISTALSSIDRLWDNSYLCTGTWANCIQFNVSRNYSAMTNGTGGHVYIYNATPFRPFDNVSQSESLTAAAVVTNPANLVYNLTATVNLNRVNVNLNITVPTGEPSGSKSATIYFKASAG